MSATARPGGIEYYLPLFFEQTPAVRLSAPGCRAGDTGQARSGRAGILGDTRGRYRLLSGDKDKPLLPPSVFFCR